MYQKSKRDKYAPVFSCSEQIVIRPRAQNAYQQDQRFARVNKKWLCPIRFDKQKGER